MSNILTSPAYREFLQKRCEEKILEDERCIEINRKILQLENELIPILSAEAKRIFFEIDALTNELLIRIPAICHR